MKKILFLCLFCMAPLAVLAQDTVKRANRTGDFNEEFTVLKSNKKMRQGSYQLFYQRKLAAVGKYDQGKRTGIWNYYRDGSLVQQYDFTADKMIAVVPEKEVIYTTDAAQGQAVTAPVAIGGLIAGLRHLAAYTDYASALSELKGQVKILHSVSIDSEGIIVKWTTFFKDRDGAKITRPIFSGIPDDLVLFIPAAAGGNKIPSVITFQEADKTGSAHEERTVITETKMVGRPAGSGGGRP